MKKFLGVILVLVCFITPAFAEPVSQEVLNQARTQAGLFMDLKNALGLEWLDEYNIYLTDPTKNPAPSWASSVDELINKNYLSVAFPTDFTISPAGKEVTISRTITNQGIKDALPIYLPSISISGDTVSLLVQRPAQWVAWEAGLNSKISRDGEGYSDSGLDVLDDTVLEFGTRTGIEFASDSKIEFINGDGKLIGIDSLEYKDQELDDRFVNVAGDTMTGSLTAPEYHVTNGNFRLSNNSSGQFRIENIKGSYPGQYLDINPGNPDYAYFFTNAYTYYFNKGIAAVRELRVYETGTYLNATEGKIAGNIIWHAGNDGPGSGLDADTLDGLHESAFARSGHGHNYVSREGDTMEGNLTMTGSTYITSPEYRINNADTRIYEGGNNAVRIRTPSGYVDIGPMDTTLSHFKTDRSGFHFDKPVYSSSKFQIWNTSTYLSEAEGKIAGNEIWHAGNDGSGSGLDADLLDGKDSKNFVPFTDLGMQAVVDFNDFTRIGFFFGPGPTQGITIKNFPPEVGVDVYSLLVEGNEWDLFQTIKTISLGRSPLNNRVWTRTRLGVAKAWSPWREVVRKPTNYLRVSHYVNPGVSYNWYKGSGTTYVKVYVYGSEEFANQPNGISKFGDYLSSPSRSQPAFGTINVTSVSSVPLVVGAGTHASGDTSGGIIIIEEYSGPPGP